MEDYYKILECDQQASSEEIKKQYKNLALKKHPDKSIGDDEKANAEFGLLNKAAKTLLDEKERFKYDASLLVKSHSDKLINDELTLEEFTFNEDTSSYVYDCRCSGQFSIEKEDIEKIPSSIDGPRHVVVDCDSCSLSVRLIIAS